MNLICQKSALEVLDIQAKGDKHSVLIEGPSGSGKTYLAKQYAKFLNISDFVIVPSTVNDIRNAIDSSYELDSKVVFCIENLDSGVVGASYALLKFLEEPRWNVYIVVTCSSIYNVPDTIISRSSVVETSLPTLEDLRTFASSYNKSSMITSRPVLWSAVRNLSDVDYFMSLSSTYCDHLENLVSFISSKKSVSEIVWSISHYPDNTEIPSKFAIQSIISSVKNPTIKKHAMACIEEIINSRVSSHAILSKFVMESKYGD